MRQGRPSGTLTMLFTDLVQSTDLMSRLGEAAFDELRRAHFAALRQAIERTGGEEVKTLGDGVLAVFGSAADAVSCAIAMQQAADRQARRAAVPLAIRVGLALGDVSFEEDDVFGTPVVQAARLAAAARAGQVLATAVVRMVAGGRTGAAFTDLGLLELKGLPEPVAACEVAWEPLPEPSVPLPTMLTDVGRIFVGRDDDLERLGRLWKEVVAGERRVALLAGEPGVGKTRLAAELAGMVHDEGATVLVGRCDEDLGVPYQPFVEAFRHFVDHTPPEELAGRLGRYGGELTRLVPELPERVPDLPSPLRSDPETERYRLFDAVAVWLGGASTETPLTLVLDDLQWAAKPTLLLLRHVVRSPELKRVLVLGIYRDTELGHDHPLVEVLADLRRQGGVDRLSLLGLDSSGVAAFMEQAAGHELDDEDMALARAIYEETEGNPFFVREVLRHLAETGALEQREGRWVTRLPIEELGIPEGVREVVGRRLSHLSKEANRVLRVAAVAGPEFDLPVLQAATGDFAEEDLLSALEEATAARLVIEVRGPAARYRFAHALVRDTLYAGLSAGRRVTLHRRVAEAIESVHGTALDDHLPALAHHWARASAPAADTARAVDYAARAGDRALAQLANDEAVAYYRQALELLDVAEGPPDEARRLELLISLGDAQRRAGDLACRETLLDASRLARERGDALGMARAALANSRGTFSTTGVIDAERVEALEAALEALGDSDAPRRARLLAILAVELMWSSDAERRHALSDEALVLARRHDDPGVLGSVIGLRWATLWHPRWARERLDLATELLSIAELTGDPYLRFWGLWRRALASMELGNAADADRCRHSAQRQADDLGQPFLRACVGLSEGAAAVASGRLADAEEGAREFLTLGRESLVPDAEGLYTAQLAGIRYEQGRLGELEATLADTVTRFPAVSLFRAMLALAYCELGRLADARSAFAPLAGGDLGFYYFAAPTAALLATVCAELGDAGEATVLAEIIAPYGNQVASHPTLWLGSFSHHLALLATTQERFSDAEDHFRTSAATHERMGAPTWLARTRLEWARMLVTRSQPGDAERARELLGQALATAREFGLGNVERRAVTLLQ